MTTLLTERLSQRAANDPLAALLLAQVNQLSEAESEEPVDAELLARRLERAMRTIARLRSELAAANVMARHVADVLGACPACWGLDHFCRQCLGEGAPGSREPNVEALVAWVNPALARAGLSIRTTRPAAPQDEDQ